MARSTNAEIEVRLERIEAMLVLLCQEAARGQGQMGKPFWDYIDEWQHNHSEQAPALGIEDDCDADD